jgi:hypothetical protein
MDELAIIHSKVSVDATIEELEAARLEWLVLARGEKAYPDIIWTIVRYLGEFDTHISGHKTWVVEHRGIEVFGNEVVDKFSVGDQAYVTRRSIHVWVGNGYVMHWVWMITDVPGALPREVENLSSFVPGNWLPELLTRANEAWMKKAQSEGDVAETARLTLAKQLLVGVDI